MTTTLPAPGADRHTTAEVEPVRLDHAKRSFATRTVFALGGAHSAWRLDTSSTPRAGDLVLARVTHIGQHERIERPDGRRATLFPGDEVVVAYGARYAPDQFEAVVPSDLGTCHLVAAGGIAGRVTTAHERMAEPTQLAPLGLLADDHGVISLQRYATVAPCAPRHRVHPRTIAVAGTAMNAGKTTSAAALVRGLTRLGLRVGAAKVTGTGAGGDVWHLSDAGAAWALDFTDAGFATTFHTPVPDLVGVFGGLTRNLAEAGADVIVLELADGVFQPESAALLSLPQIRHCVDGVVFAAADALGTVAGVQRLRSLGYTVRAASGRFTAAPLATREAAAALDVPVAGPRELAEPGTAARIAGVGIGTEGR